ELFDLDHVSDGDLVLLAAGLDDCVRRHRATQLSCIVRLAQRYPLVRERVWVRSRYGPAVFGVSRRTTGQGYVRRGARVKSPQVTVHQSSWTGGPAGRAAERRRGRRPPTSAAGSSSASSSSSSSSESDSSERSSESSSSSSSSSSSDSSS